MRFKLDSKISSILQDDRFQFNFQITNMTFGRTNEVSKFLSNFKPYSVSMRFLNRNMIRLQKKFEIQWDFIIKFKYCMTVRYK